MAGQGVLKVRISKATKVVWEGDAASVSSKNADGPFDVLPMHANFLTLIREEPIVIRCADGSQETYNFNQAVMYVKDDEVKIYTEIA
jgi:F0F1-type ATP synthase epsilon subunit